MRTALALLGAILIAVEPQAVRALSCDIPVFQHDYWWHEQQPETYALVHGALSGLKLVEVVKTKQTADTQQMGRTVYSASFVGFRASSNAFDQPFATEVTLIFPDYSVFGGGIDSAAWADDLVGEVGLIWLLKTEQGYQAEHGICAGIVDTDPKNVRPALRCLRGGLCPKP